MCLGSAWAMWVCLWYLVLATSLSAKSLWLFISKPTPATKSAIKEHHLHPLRTSNFFIIKMSRITWKLSDEQSLIYTDQLMSMLPVVLVRQVLCSCTLLGHNSGILPGVVISPSPLIHKICWERKPVSSVWWWLTCMWSFHSQMFLVLFEFYSY